ncbi:D-aspartate oxidase-like [Mya arenaria]|uniref:D-aspartate oxidase-like n=1 Tax=Mya arenaria TaxID=6604 RepID=UPI0022E0F943|nr:D-aspartate oxidase-like [Mya arenaria]
MMSTSGSVAVLGAGVIGLSTAAAVLDLLPDVKVTVMADKFGADTTSYGSGGLFVPSLFSAGEDNKHRYRQWMRESGSYFRELLTGPEAGVAGAMALSGFLLARTEEDIEVEPPYRDDVISFREMTKQELHRLGLSEYKHGYAITTYIINQSKYLQWMQKNLEKRGVTFIQKRFTDLSELCGQFGAVVNCTSLGSRELCGDRKLYALRGHMVRVRAPWIKHWVYVDHDTYIIPGEDLVALGGSKVEGDETLIPDPARGREIRDRCERLCPAIKCAEADHEWVGLRPCRKGGIRLEIQTLSTGGRSMKVIHNYGHGTSGVAYSWGTALEAARYVRDVITPGARL